MSNLKLMCAKVKSLRLGMKWTQAQLASKVGCSGVYITKIENGREPTLELAFKLENALKWHPRELSQWLIDEAYRKAGGLGEGPKVREIKVDSGSQVELRSEDGKVVIPVKVNLPREVYIKLDFQ